MEELKFMDEFSGIAPTHISRRAAAMGLLSMAAGVELAAAAPALAAVARSPLPPLVHSGAPMAVELAPVHLALRNLYGQTGKVRNGGVIDLIGKARKADVASNGDTQNLRHSVAEPGMRIIMTIAEGYYPIIARCSTGITKLADLKGKRVLGYSHTTAGFFLYKMLRTVGLTLSDVTLVETPLGEIGKVIANKEVDAVAIWEPDSEQILHAFRRAGEDVTIFNGKNVYYERYNLCTTADALADPAKRRQIITYMRAIIAATKAMNSDPAVAAQGQAMVAQSGGLYTAADIAAGWSNLRFVANFDDGLLDLFEDEEGWLAALEGRQPRSRAQLATLIDRTAYDEAAGAARS